MSKFIIEEFRGEHNKLYLTCQHTYEGYGELYFAAKKRFKVANSSILIIKGWIVGDLLYTQNTPQQPRFISKLSNARCVWVAHVLCFRRSKK